MALGEALVAALVGVPAYDWLMVTGAAAKMSSFDYQYWPLSRLRITTIGALAASVFFAFLLIKPPEPATRLLIFLPAFVAVIIHNIIAMVDIFAQRRLAAQASDED